jgi:ribosomal protein L21E
MGLDTGHLHLWYQILDKRKIEDRLPDTVSGTGGGDRDLTYPVASGSLNIGDCSYLTTGQQWGLSKRNDGTTMPSWGVVITTATGTATVRLEGLVTLSDYAGSFTTGDLVYVNIDGRLTDNYPTEAAQYLQRMGFVYDGPDGKFEIDPDDTMVLIN